MGGKAAGDNLQFQCIWPKKFANKCIVQWWFKEFYKRDERLEDESNG